MGKIQTRTEVEVTLGYIVEDLPSICLILTNLSTSEYKNILRYPNNAYICSIGKQAVPEFVIKSLYSGKFLEGQ